MATCADPASQAVRPAAPPAGPAGTDGTVGTGGPGEAGSILTSAAGPGRALRRVPRSLAVLAGYVALAVLIFRAAWAEPGGVLYGESDSVLFAWYLGWIPHALTSGLDPFVTSHLNAPTGTNILWSTPVPLLGLLVAPVTALFGPVVSLNLLLTLAPALSAFTLFRVLLRWLSAPAAALAGLLYGFGPYMIGESYGHLHLTFAVFPPLLLALLDDLVVRGRPPVRTGALLGLAVAAQALISEEIVATSALMGGAGLVIAALLHRDVARARAGALARGLAVCAAVAAALLLWPLAVQFLGPLRVHGNIQPHNVAVSDLLTFVTPTPAQLVAPDIALRHSARFTGNAVEVTGYLGLPLVLVAAAVAIRLRRDPLVALFAPLAVVTAVLSLGGHLHVDGRITGIPLPWLALEDAPVINSALPSRFALYLMMFVGIVVATGLHRAATAARPGARQPGSAPHALHTRYAPHTRRTPHTQHAPHTRHAPRHRAPRRGTAGQETSWRGAGRPGTISAALAGRTRLVMAVLAAVTVVVPLLPRAHVTTAAVTPAFFTGAAVEAVPEDATALVLPYPYPSRTEAMLWQAEAHYRFRLPGCYCTIPGPDGRAVFNAWTDPLNSALVAIEQGRADADAALADPAVRSAFAQLAPAAVILGPTPRRAELSRLMTGIVGTPPKQVDGVELWLLRG
ncbi:hypothetical protein [Frankia sp. R43]|uniref:hypothetical protein n=1 Tax=Frankia sp. R43 TaxID=269536 RepID=UPI000B036661|nr:hypothetical protein [Frankia sp. R43]